MIDPNKLVIADLSNKERSYLKSHIIRNGFASICLFFGYVFGCLGQFSPEEVFNYDDIVSNIINKRLRKQSKKINKRLRKESKILSNKIEELKSQLIIKGFHEECIIEWIENHDECPICKIDKFEDCLE
jgi:hypothetical protein